MILNQYRQWADTVGGEVGERIHMLIDELEEARLIISEKKLPPLLGSKEAAELLEIDPKNMHHARKTKSFPEPNGYAGNRPLWFEQTLLMYKERKNEKKDE